MLTLTSGHRSVTCEGSSRRDFLMAGTLALGGLGLPWLQALRAANESTGETGYVRDKAVILVFLAGGASHIETFNPNMDGPEQSRSITGEVKSSLPGVTLGGTFPMLAKLANRVAIVRNFRHPIGNHDQAISHVLTGGTDPDGQKNQGFSMGSMYARLRGANHPRTGMPTYHMLPETHKDPQYTREMNRVQLGSRPGALGPSFAPFMPSGKGPAMENLTLRLSADRLKDRRHLLGQLDGLKHGLDDRDTDSGPGTFERQAVELLLGGATKAFDLSKESKTTRDRYDTRSFKVGKKTFLPSSLGDQMLLARRLVEAGAGFVTVQSAGWDMHADGNNPGVKDGMTMLGGPLDRALSALLEDLESRGLSEKTLVILTGDFGRTPKINNRGGRDHWANLCTLALWGGGLKMGQVIGRSDRQNAKPDGNAYSTPNLLATVMHHLFDVGTLRLSRSAPSPLLKLIEDHKPIGELF
jgi:hypothetical protein